MSEQSKHYAKTALVAVAACFVFLLALGAAIEAYSQTTTTEAAPAASQPSSDNSGYKQRFMSGCMDSGSVTTKQCGCMYDYLLDQYGIEKMVDMGNNLDSEDTNSAVTSAAIHCM